MVSQQEFRRLVDKKYGGARRGSAKDQTGLNALMTGKLSGSDAGLRALKKQLKRDLRPRDVDLSIVERGSVCARGPFFEIMDVEPRDDVDQETYIASVGQLIVALAAQGLRLVTAADFEHLLPFGGKPGTRGAAVQVEATIVEVFVGAMLSELDPSGSPANAVDEDAALRTALAVVGESDRDSVRLALDYALTHPEIDTHDWLNPLGETPDWELRRLLRRAREILWPDAGSAPSQPPDGVIVVGTPDADA